MQSPKISIVLPTRNGSRYLPEAIESCLAQTFTDWELIVVDDASEDRTPEIISWYAARDARLRTMRNPAPRRLPGALNTGFRLAGGEFLTWTSDDNQYRPEALARMLAALEADPAIGAVYCDFTMIDGQGTPVRRVAVKNPAHLLLASCVGACFLYRRSVQESVGEYDEEFFLAEDYEFWLRVSERHALAPLHQDLYLYRLHGASLTEQRAREVTRAAERVRMRHIPKLKWASPAAKAAVLFNLARHAARRGEWAAAAGRVLLAGRYSARLVLTEGARVVSRRLRTAQNEHA